LWESSSEENFVVMASVAIVVVITVDSFTVVNLSSIIPEDNAPATQRIPWRVDLDSAADAPGNRLPAAADVALLRHSTTEIRV
jgi:hypothetical protein